MNGRGPALSVYLNCESVAQRTCFSLSKTVSESHLFQPAAFFFERKQILSKADSPLLGIRETRSTPFEPTSLPLTSRHGAPPAGHRIGLWLR